MPRGLRWSVMAWTTDPKAPIVRHGRWTTDPIAPEPAVTMWRATRMLATSLGVTWTPSLTLYVLYALHVEQSVTATPSATLAKIRTLALMGTATATPIASFGFPPNSPALSTINSTGSYTIPRWCDYLDLIVLGAGGGGGGGNAILSGTGGNPGTFSSVTLQRGVDIAWTATSFSVTVGGGGGGGTGNFALGLAGTAGGSTTINWGGGTLSGNGGGGGGGGNGGSRTGKAVTTGNTNGNRDLALHGQTYVGGGTSNGAGSAPGGGGYGGASSNGKSGAAGRAWVRAYQ